MRTWFRRHPTVGFLLCLLAAAIHIAGFNSADTTAGRVWCAFGAVAMSGWAVYWWEQS